MQHTIFMLFIFPLASMVTNMLLHNAVKNPTILKDCLISIYKLYNLNANGTQEEIEGEKVQALQHLKIQSDFVQYSKCYLHSTLCCQGSNSAF